MGGLCQCGCGQETKPCRDNDATRGYVKGKPMRFCPGHNMCKKKPRSPVDYVLEDHGYATPCWVWQHNCLPPFGYPQVWVGSKAELAHRVYYERYKGPIPEGLHLDHLCRFPSCVNPDHLEPVTVAVNTQRGITAKLNADKVRQIRSLHESGERQRAIARNFNIDPSTVSDVVNRVSWREV